jgi:hypothetical protein
MLLLYGMARIISIQRRVRDLEARPPVDEITLRGAIRLQLNDLVSDLEQNLRAKHTDSNILPNFKNNTFQTTQLDYKNYNQPEFASVNTFDDEINQVFEIANTVKESLPNLKLFANVLKNQRNQKNQNSEKNKIVDNIVNVNSTNSKDVHSFVNANDFNEFQNNVSSFKNDITLEGKQEKNYDSLQELQELQEVHVLTNDMKNLKNDVKDDLKKETTNKIEEQEHLPLDTKQVIKNQVLKENQEENFKEVQEQENFKEVQEQLKQLQEQEVVEQEVVEQERWSTPLKKKSKALTSSTSTKVKTKKKIVNDE